LSTPTLRRLLFREGFWLVIAPSLSFGITPLIAPFGKPKTITSRVDSVVFVEAPNMASSTPCSYQAFLASTLLNVRAKAPLGSFLALVIRSSLLGWPLIDLTTSAAVLALPSILL
jgi:hypothetical protein